MTSENRKFWKEFCSKEYSPIVERSDFAQHVYNDHIKSYNDQGVYLKIGDFGCGNCRDSRFFAKHNIVYSIDKDGVNNVETDRCQLILEDVDVVLKKQQLKTLLDLVYMRWFLHAMSYENSTSILNETLSALKPGGLICIEVRSMNDEELIKTSEYNESDKSYTTTHKRWPYTKEQLEKFAKTHNLEILELSEDYYSKNNNTETKDPLLIRCILQRKLLPYYENSNNYKLYEHIPQKMKSKTLQTYKQMDIMNQLLGRHNIKYVAVGGTILGLNRHGGIIPWDNDIDIGFTSDEWKKLFDIKDELVKAGLNYTRNGPNPDGKTIHCHFGKIDCFLIERKGDYYSGTCRTSCHVDEYSNIYKQKFGYTYLYAPICSKASLSHRYNSSYFTTGDVSDNYHFWDKKVPRFTLTKEDRSFQILTFPFDPFCEMF
jgi:hypothetical protein